MGLSGQHNTVAQLSSDKRGNVAAAVPTVVGHQGLQEGKVRLGDDGGRNKVGSRSSTNQS